MWPQGSGGFDAELSSPSWAKSIGKKITLEVEGKTTTGKAAANAFAKGYEEESNNNIPTLRNKEVRTEIRVKQKTPAHEIMQTDISAQKTTQ